MNIVSFSGGKDSTAMLIRMLELEMPVDKIVFADTGFEFPELHEYIKTVAKRINRKIEVVYPEKTFEEWFSGKITRGKHKGKTRGFPLKAFPCYWTREAKIKPIQKICNKNDKMFIGIAYDEQHRCQDKGNLFYPLVNWKWTEQDCIDYLNKKDLFNPLYINFDRLGCYLCPKQSEKSLYVLWKQYPKLWANALIWEKRNGKRIFGKLMHEYEFKFADDYIPKKLPKYECWNGCEGVKRAFLLKQTKINSYEKTIIKGKEGGLK